MPEFTLFAIVGFIAVFSAAFMLLSDNAVYSALFLIVTMVCIAFFFILLDAPFLAMIQITVYAGAIMVLFIFVIMLLGAEKVTAGRPVFKWQAPAAFSLIMALLFAGGITIASGQVDAQSPPPADPLVRVLHSASDVGDVTVAAGEQVLAEALEFRAASDFLPVPAGEVEFTLTTADGASVTLPVELERDTEQTVVVYGEGTDIAAAIIPRDEVAPPSGNTRITVMNAFTEEPYVSLVDLGFNAQLDRDGETIADDVLIEQLELGAFAEPILVRDGEINWAFVRPNGETITTLRDVAVEGDQTELMVVSAERLVDETLRAAAIPTYIQEETPGFGSPAAIGRELFTRYMLVFQMVALLLLGAMVGAIMLTHPEGVPVRERPQGRRKVSRPLTSVLASQLEHDVTVPDAPDTPALPGERQSATGD